MSNKSLDAFRVELCALIHRFCAEWDITPAEIVGMMTMVGTTIAIEVLKQGGALGLEDGDGG